MTTPRPARRPPVVVRRFAGTTRHAEALARPLRVAHLTDLHVGLVTPLSAVRAAIEAVNAERPDLVALTGDFVCFGQAYLGRLEELVARLEAPAVAVLGNHDHWSGAREVRAALESGGVRVLQNETAQLDLRGEPLQVVGIDDAFTGHADVARALAGYDPALPSLGLSHVGEEAPRLWAAGVPLVLSGHTHAGQVTVARFDRLLMNRLLGHSYVHGLYGCRRAPAPLGALYVAAGIGAPRMPLRLGERARREVALFELGTPPGSFVEHHAEQRALPGRPPAPWVAARRRGIVAREQRRRARFKAFADLWRGPG